MDATTLTMIAVGVVIGILTMSNWNLRREVHNLRQQVAALIVLLDRKGVMNERDREALGRPWREGSLDPTPGHFRYRGDEPV